MLGSKFADALTWAAQLHSQQVRKGSGTPYIAHLLAVAALVLEHGADETEAIAALLHDAVEDQGGAATREAIRTRFGEEVVALVDWASDTDQVPKPPWRQRKEAHVARVRTAPAEAQRILAADKLHNARSLLADLDRHGSSLWSQFQGGAAGTLWYYRAMSDALCDVPPVLSAQLVAAVQQLERAVSEPSR